MYTDGSTTSGMGGVGVIIFSPKKDVLKYEVQLQFLVMNNEAEYEAELTGLRVAKALGVRNLKLNFDSKLVIGQMNNEYEAKEDKMNRYLALTNQLISNFDDVKITQVPREENSKANEVARLASSETSERRPSLLMEMQYLPSIEGIEVNYVWSGESWTDLIITYIKTGNLLSDPTEARKVKVKWSRFTILNDELYKRGFSQPYLKCLDLGDAKYVLREIHEGVCGNHFGPHSLVGWVVRVGYFWPTMQRDVAQIVQKCNKCQRFWNVQHVPTKHLTTITSPWPFSTWEIDIMRPLPRGKKQVKFLVVTVDYFTKWVETEPLAVITKAKIQHFVWKNLVCWFGIP